MKLAINYSPPASSLYQAGRIRLDFFKCPPWPGMIAEARTIAPVAVHFELRAGSGRLHETEWAAIEDFREQTGTPYVNLHLAPLTSDFPGMSADTCDPADVCRVLDALLSDVYAVTERFGAKNVIAENITYYGPQEKFVRPGMQPEIICRVVEETGCGLLLDIPHARIAARYLGMAAQSYMQQLPTARLRELHFTGIHEIANRPQDHLAALANDWQWLAWVLERIRENEWAKPWLLAFEYGGIGKFFAENCDPQVIATQMPHLWEMVQPV
ncbi:MAG: DUF692 family multinuclear iron-containing protein [Chloroflexota bacterium]